jgi:hypothetical protein
MLESTDHSVGSESDETKGGNRKEHNQGYTMIMEAEISYETLVNFYQAIWSNIPRKGIVLGAFAKLRKATISFVMSVRLSVSPHETTLLPLDGFS